ncbi:MULTISPECIES: redoxin family protein [unclassified Saccharicrinis]|uniref:redoxin family protein n=1 Tax=unclassified Saccharicrinis TaxID=2646859 RepID=UPI003D34986A
MKIKTLAIALSFTLLSLCNIKAQSYKISGEIKGLDVDTGYIYVEDANAERGYRFEKIPFENGKFNYEAEIKETQVVTVSFRSDALTKKVGRGIIPAKSALLQYIAYPGANIKIKGQASDFCDAYPYGDKENEVLTDMNKWIYPLMNEMANYSVSNAVDSTLTEAQKEVNNKKAEKLFDEVLQKKKDFLESNASTVAGLWLMEDMIIRSQIEIEKVAELMDKVDNKYIDLTYYKKVSARVKGFKETGVGMMAPEIKGINLLDNSNFNLESLRGKFVIVDFWGTWCGPCVAGMPEMKKFRDEYKDRLQIVGLAKDRNAEVVKKMMDKKGVDWPNIMVGEDDQDYVAKYNVQGYPTKILLDRNGKILMRSVGELEGFYEEVEKLMGK